MDFDDFYQTVGVFGLYQKVKYFLLCFTNMLPPVMVYAWTFIAGTPTFRCKTPYDDYLGTNITAGTLSSYIPSAAQCRESQGTISLKECQRCFIVNIDNGGDLTACQNYIFDRTYYQSTLVEDVSYLYLEQLMMIYLITILLLSSGLWYVIVYH